MNLFIRRMIPADIDQVVAIDQVSFSLPWPARSFQYELTENPASRSWVVELDGRIVGMIVIWLIVDEAHIATIATHPEFRRQGIGGQLLLHALRSARMEGARKAFLEVRAGNLAAQAMYRKHGFKEDGRRPRYYNDNHEDAVLMSLDRMAEEP
jgi:ribosomal-protein-alanine N-acetyltransferase